MKLVKIFFFFVLFLLFLTIPFRGFVFRNVVDYHSFKDRKISFGENFKAANFRCKNIDEILDFALKQTSEKLEFKLNNPGKFMLTGKANCVGYSSFFASYISQLLLKNNLKNEWKVCHKVGKLEFFGIDVHQYFSSPSFKDHDFVVVENLKTKEIIAVDAALYDYTGIERVSLK